MQSKLLILILYLFYFHFTFTQAASAKLNRLRVYANNELNWLDYKFAKRQEIPATAAAEAATNQEMVGTPPIEATVPVESGTNEQPTSLDATDCAKKIQAEKPDDPVGEFLNCLNAGYNN